MVHSYHSNKLLIPVVTEANSKIKIAKVVLNQLNLSCMLLLSFIISLTKKQGSDYPPGLVCEPVNIQLVNIL